MSILPACSPEQCVAPVFTTADTVHEHGGSCVLVKSDILTFTDK